MAKRKQPENTKTFNFLNINPKETITDDCAIRSIALCLNKPWEEVYRELFELSLKKSRILNDAMNIQEYLKLKGFTKQPSPKHSGNKRYSGSKFCEEICSSNYNYIINIGSHHMSAVIDNKINDTWNCSNNAVGNYWVIPK